MALDYFRVLKGVQLDDLVEVLHGTADPSAGGGVVASIGSVYLKTDDGNTWHKTGSGNTAWTKLLDASGASNEDTYQNTFMGKSSIGSITPTYSSQLTVTNADSLQTAVGKLDLATPVKVSGTNQDPAGGLVVDTVLVATYSTVEWLLTVNSNATPANKYVCKVVALNDGSTGIDYTVFSVLTLGSAITTIAITCANNGTNMDLVVTAGENVDFKVTRIAQ